MSTMQRSSGARLRPGSTIQAQQGMFQAGTCPPATVADLGLTRKAIHEARQLRDAETADPGVIRRTLDELLELGSDTDAAMVQ